MKKEHRSPRTRSVLAATGLLLLGIAPFGVAATGDALREGKRNGTTTRETEIVSNNAATTKSKGGYSTRQSNLSNSGGGAIYGCRSTGGTNRNPCLRANNLSTGLAFEFNATNGSTTGTITAGSGGDSKKPFTTNATGVATGLNADRVDGKSSGEIVSEAQGGARGRFALINEAGQIEQQTGGFTVVDCYQTNANCYIDTGGDVRNRGVSAQIAIGNTDGSARLSGETGTAPCGATFVACAPPNTERNEVVVVAPRQSDGSTAPADNRFRFYVYISDSTAG